MPLPRYVSGPLGVDVCFVQWVGGWGPFSCGSMALIVPGISLLEGNTVWKMTAEKTWLCTGKEACAFKLGQRLSLDPNVLRMVLPSFLPQRGLPGAKKEGVFQNATLRSANRPWAGTMQLAMMALMGLPLRPLPALCTCETPSHRTQASARLRV